jgi:phosphatidylethanolamine/phosphatidyl-N-methylethanolamine N-methyltransferase
MEKVLQQPRLDENAVRLAYRGWAPVYDYSFGLVSAPARRFAVKKLNEFDGHVLEVGVGTGLSLPRYKRGLKVTGIDLSPDMLDKAAVRVEKLGLTDIRLSVMDASKLTPADRRLSSITSAVSRACARRWSADSRAFHTISAGIPFSRSAP